MTKIIAKLTGGDENFKLLFDGEDVPNIGLVVPKVESAQEYLPFYVPENKNEWFYVELDLEQIDEMIGPYSESNNFGTSKIEQFEYMQIQTIFEFNGRKILFSRVNNASKIGEEGKTLINFEETGLSVSRTQHSIEFSSEVDAYYDGQKRIYFKKYSKAKPLFRGFDVFYQDASRSDKEIFLEHDIFAVGDLNPDFIGSREAKLMKEITQNPDFDLNSNATQLKIRNYANDYPQAKVRTNDENKLKVSSKEDLTAVLKLLSEKYFTSEITNQVFEAKSLKLTD